MAGPYYMRLNYLKQHRDYQRVRERPAKRTGLELVSENAVLPIGVQSFPRGSEENHG